MQKSLEETTVPRATFTRSPALVRTELLISHVLRYGMILCASLIAFGLGLQLFGPSTPGTFSEENLRKLLHGLPSDSYEVIASVEAFRDGLLSFNPDAWMAFGLLLLIFLPIIRVGMTVLLFLIEQDYIYLGITLFVLLVLLSGMIFGKTL